MGFRLGLVAALALAGGCNADWSGVWDAGYWIGAGTPQALACHGSFATLSRGFVTARPSELNFVVWWDKPAIATDTGRVGRITALTALEIAFDVRYDTYTASYRINRVDGTITQTSNFGGRFAGACALKPLRTRF